MPRARSSVNRYGKPTSVATGISLHKPSGRFYTRTAKGQRRYFRTWEQARADLDGQATLREPDFLVTTVDDWLFDGPPTDELPPPGTPIDEVDDDHPHRAWLEAVDEGRDFRRMRLLAADDFWALARAKFEVDRKLFCSRVGIDWGTPNAPVKQSVGVTLKEISRKWREHAEQRHGGRTRHIHEMTGRWNEFVRKVGTLMRDSDSRVFQFAIYWLNPLLVKEVYNSGHMELIVIALAAGALLAAVRRRSRTSALLLALAAGAKIWPVIWLPFLPRHAARTKRQIIAGAALFAGTVIILTLPIVVSRLDGGSGFRVYGQRWQMNDSAYLIIYEGVRLVSEAHAHLIARILVGLLLVAVVAWLIQRQRASQAYTIPNLLVVTAVLFLLSPTQFPWYYLWLLPILALRPSWALLALTMSLPLYYLRYPLDALGKGVWLDYGLVWVEFVPIWLLLAWELFKRSSKRVDRAPAVSRVCMSTIT